MKTLLQLLFFFLLVTQICFAQWVPVGLENKAIKDIATGSNLFAITTDGVLYRSTNDGIDWTQIVESGAVDVALSPPISGKLFMVKSDSLFSSSDNGNSWNSLNILEQLPPPPPDFSVTLRNISISNLGTICCGFDFNFPLHAYYTGFALSFDEGPTWTTPGLDTKGGILFDFMDHSLITVGLYTSTMGGAQDVYLSSDYGNSWNDLGWYPEVYPTLLGIFYNGNILFGNRSESGSEGGIFLSTDSCGSWTRISNVIPQAGLSIESGMMLAGTESTGIFLFSDNGDSLGSRNNGLTNLNIHTLSYDNNNYVYAGTDNGVWRRPLSEVTSVEENNIPIPSRFNLSQNYPNPFNPRTKIKYSVPQTSEVQIKVFDILGKEIETLVNEEKPAGTYELTWSAANLPSGVYFYQIKAGRFVETRKMILMK